MTTSEGDPRRDRLRRGFEQLRKIVADGQIRPWADPQARVGDPLHEFGLFIDMFEFADDHENLRDLRARVLEAALEPARAVFRQAEDRQAAGARIAGRIGRAFASITTTSAYEMLLDATLSLAELPAEDPESDDDGPWFSLPELPVDDGHIRSPAALLRILGRVLKAWTDWDTHWFDQQTLVPVLRACVEAEVLDSWRDEFEERLLWLLALRSAIESLLEERDPEPLQLTAFELACAVVERITERLKQRDELDEPEVEDEVPELEAWEGMWSRARLTHAVALATEIHWRFGEDAQAQCGQGRLYLIQSPAPHMPRLLAAHLHEYYPYDHRLKPSNSGVGMLAEFPDAIDLQRSSEHLDAGTWLALEVLEILEQTHYWPAVHEVARETLRRYQQQLEPLRARLAEDPAAPVLDEVSAALAEFLAP